MLLSLGLLFVAAAIACGYLAFAGVPASRISKERIAGFAVAEQRSLLTRLSDGVVSQVEGLMRRRGWRPFTASELELAGVRMPVASLVVLVTSIGVICFAVGLLLTGSAIVAALIAVVVPFSAKAWIKVRASGRRKKFAEQLPQALQMMASSLRAGHSLPRSMDAVSQDAEAPMGEELARVVNENRLGRDLVVALEEVSSRMESKDFSWVAAAIGAQRETGGNLNEILDQVSETIRERNHIRQQVMSLSAEGRLSAYILMALPVGIGGYYALVSGDTLATFVDSNIGKLLLIGSLVMYVLGGFWMRSIVRIEF